MSLFEKYDVWVPFTLAATSDGSLKHYERVFGRFWAGVTKLKDKGRAARISTTKGKDESK